MNDRILAITIRFDDGCFDIYVHPVGVNPTFRCWGTSEWIGINDYNNLWMWAAECLIN